MEAGGIRHVLVVGAGTMGTQIAFQCAWHGYEVSVYDRDTGALETLEGRMCSYAESYAGRDGNSSRIDGALERVSAHEDPRRAAEGTDLLSESVPEDPELKGEVLSLFDRLCPKGAVFTTNSSTLLPSQIAGATGRPSRFAALHFHNPVLVSNVADVMPHPGTSEEVVDLLVAFARSIGQIPILLRREHSGYVFNSMLDALLTEAQSLAAEGVAPVEDVDRAWMGVMKTRIGPFGIMDLIGLDTVWQIVDYWARKIPSNPTLKRNADFLKPYVERGDLGQKSGRGFYDYPNPAYAREDFLQRG
jgi:3-hydroxybutyryl-CoA dehydrogenase